MAKTTYVVQASGDVWIVQRQGKKSPESKHKLKPKAIAAGRRLAKRAEGFLKIKGKSGKIQATRNYSK